VRYHWIRDVLNSKKMHLEKVHTNDNGADMLTKVVMKQNLKVCCQIAGMVARRQRDPL
jgi:hypothetical protein